MVVFEQGVPKKEHYRRFNIRSVQGPDDFASMEEVLTRRFNRWQAAQELAEAPGKKPDAAFALLPDLLMVDGGKGQLGRAVAVLERFGLAGQGAGGRAGQAERGAVPARLARHRCCCRATRRGCTWCSACAMRRTASPSPPTATCAPSKAWPPAWITIPGIGPARRKALLSHFGSIEDIQDASIEELVAIPGITPKLAEGIKANLT